MIHSTRLGVYNLTAFASRALFGAFSRRTMATRVAVAKVGDLSPGKGESGCTATNV